jgi:hypothetical protein
MFYKEASKKLKKQQFKKQLEFAEMRINQDQDKVKEKLYW